MLSAGDGGSAVGEPAYLTRMEGLLVAATLGVLVCLNLPSLGSDPWHFRTPKVTPHGPFGSFVRLAHSTWDVGMLRSAVAVAGVLVVAFALIVAHRGRLRSSLALALTAACLALLILPGTILQVGLRDATAPWFYVNDSTYQIELAGKLVRDGHSPYGHDYSASGMERFYSFDGSPPPRSAPTRPALEHFPYFPGSALAAAATGWLPAPLGDYRLIVMLATFGLFGAALLFTAPLGVRMAVGAALAGNPLAVRASWFGTADAPSVVLLLITFAMVQRSRFAAAGAALGLAILMKQFALVAVPFLALALIGYASRKQAARAAAALALVFLLGMVPFAIVDAHSLWSDTIGYGAETYRIIGYGLSSILLRAHWLSGPTGYYPFPWIVLAVWLPVTALLLRLQRRGRLAWGAAGFAGSIYTLLFISRVFQTSYLIWPLTAIGVSIILALGQEAAPAPIEPEPRPEQQGRRSLLSSTR